MIREPCTPVRPPIQPLIAAARGSCGGGRGERYLMPNEEEPMGDGQRPEEDSTDVAEASGESQEAKGGTVPVKPSFAEVERHRIAHYPYRCWCPECVMGQATGSGHLRKE